MDLSNVLLGFEQINPGFDLRGDPGELQRAAVDARQALDPSHVVWKTIRFLMGTKLRDWYNAESVEEREKLHGEIRGLGELESNLRGVITTNEAVQEDLQREDSGFRTF